MTDLERMTDTELNAFVDGELVSSDQARVTAWLAEHPEDAERVETYRRQNSNLHALFDSVADETAPSEMTELVTASRPRAPQRVWMQIAAAVVLLLTGAAGGWGLHGLQGGLDLSSAPRYVERAVSAHVVYTAEKRHAVEVEASQEAHLVKWLSKRLGHPLRIPSLAASGYKLVGGRMLEEAGRPAAHFMYQDSAKRRLTVYVRAYDGAETAFKFVGGDGVSTFYWIDAPFAYALTGELPRPDLLNIANIVYEELTP
jgi:anti-sigma factor RsiW